jgi:hypothetical protein
MDARLDRIFVTISRSVADGKYRHLVKPAATDVSRVRQKSVDAADAKGLASAATITASVQAFDDFLDTERA